MEAVTAGADARHAQGTGSKTIADLLPLAVEKYGDAPAQRFKVGEEWRDSSYADLGEVVKEIALGLIDLGIEPGEKISILAHTRPEWTHACFGILTAGGTLVTIYQTNSPEECQYVLSHSDSRAVFVEDAEQLAKVRAIEADCPELQHVIVLDPGDADIGDAITLEKLRERGRGRDASE
jgi:long-chain acyl-CoA synthetase